MCSARTFLTPVARAAFRPQAVRMPLNSRLASIRAASTISEVITNDHRELKKYYEEIVNNPDNIDHQTRYGNQFTWELARHSVAEELLVYPALEKYLGDKGKEHADHDRAEHHKVCLTVPFAEIVTDRLQVKVLLKDFQNMSARDSAYVPKLKEIWSLLEHHIEEEESKDLPALEKALSSSDNRGSSESLAKNFGRTKAFVPSRSHPSAGENPYLCVSSREPL
jgi:hemerythrin-like domain-containing protein